MSQKRGAEASAAGEAASKKYRVLNVPQIDAARLEQLDHASQEKLKAAYAAVDENVHDNMVIGIGSGSTVVFAAQRIGERVKKEKLSLICIPTSYQALQLIREHQLVLGDLTTTPKIDLTIDGADEITPDLDCIKGGGGCHVQEKIVAYNSAKFVVVCDASKCSDHLGQNWRRGVPIEVVPLAAEPITQKLSAMGGKPTMRMAKAKMGPLVTDNGNFILDVDFGSLTGDVKALNSDILAIPGVVETGFFLGMASKVYVGAPDGVRLMTKASL